MIGILNAYHFENTPGSYQEEYSRLFVEFVERLFPEKKNEIKEYKVALGDFPKSVYDCDLWFITGSPKACYDDLPWIKKLISLTIEIHKEKRKLIGICFGHQLVAQALGGKVSKSPKGWGVGIRRFDILESQAWMGTADKKLSLIFSHQDQVEVLPPDAKLLASDTFCPFQMTTIGDHILTFQGHPEFTSNFARERLNSRRDLMPKETYDTAIHSLADRNDEKILSQWIRNWVISSAVPKENS